MSEIVERDVLSGSKKPDFGDALALADRKKTLMLTMLPKGTAPSNTAPQWGVESYPAPTITGAVDEAPVTTYETSGNVAALLTGRVMIQQHAIRVSRFADKVMDQVGVGKNKAYAKALARAMVILARKVETRILSDDDSFAGDATNGPETRGALSWASAAAQTDLPVDSSFRPPSAQNSTTTIANWTDSTFTDAVQSMFDSTGDAEMDLMFAVGSTLNGKIGRLTSWSKDESGFTAIRYMNQSEGTVLTQKVSVLDTQFGRAIVKPSSFINTGADPTSAASKRLGFLFPMVKEALRLRFAWPLSNDELPNDGGGRRALASTAYCLEAGNPLWLARFVPSA